ncbi:MAG TPA: hypothetical protein P5111_04520 [Kiritimatiellia bacterium]|mgnify:FL=1|nr:hypothetical protein [Kiritimatiellia bacterium]
MLRSLSILNPLIALLCGIRVAHADLVATPLRQPGSSLDISLGNEADRAVRQASRWLRLHQNPDGSWGATPRVALTALALTALAGSAHPDDQDARSRAALWLGQSATHHVSALDVHAWRMLALTLSLPDTPERGTYLQDMARRAPSPDGASADDRRFWQEVLAQAGLGPPSVPDTESTGLVARAAAIWPPPLNRTRAAWRLARLINRTAGGRLMQGETVLDWRSHLATWLISTQKSAPEGGCFWSAATDDARIAETAYGILCLLEL